MTSQASAGLLARVDGRPLRRAGVVRISPSGSVTHRESLFDVSALTRWWRAGIAQVSASRPGAAMSAVTRNR